MSATSFIDTNIVVYAASNAAADQAKRQVARVVGNPGRLVDDQQAHVRIATDGLLLAGQGDDPAIVGEFELLGGLAFQERGLEAAIEAGDNAEQLHGLAVAAREQQNHGARHKDSFDQAEQGYGGRLAGLAAAIQ